MLQQTIIVHRDDQSVAKDNSLLPLINNKWFDADQKCFATTTGLFLYQLLHTENNYWRSTF